MLTAFLAGLGWVIVSFFTLRPLIQWLLEILKVESRFAEGGSIVLWVLYWIFAFGPAFFLFATMFSALKWEKLSHEVEVKLHGPNVPNLTTNALMGFWDGLKRAPRGIALSLLGTVCAPLLFGIPSALLSGWQGTFDFTAPAFSRRGIYWPHQKSYVSQIPERKTLWVAAAISSLFPIVNLLMMPVLVAAGTSLTAQAYPRELVHRA